MLVGRAASQEDATSVWSATTLTFVPTVMSQEKLGPPGIRPLTPCNVSSPEWTQVGVSIVLALCYPERKLLVLLSLSFKPPTHPPSLLPPSLPPAHTELYFGGETQVLETPQSFTCPLCGQIGFSETHLKDHVTKKHADSTVLQEVICPVCAAYPNGDPNHLTDDLPTHLTVEHRALEISSLTIGAGLGRGFVSPTILSLDSSAPGHGYYSESSA